MPIVISQNNNGTVVVIVVREKLNCPFLLNPINGEEKGMVLGPGLKLLKGLWLDRPHLIVIMPGREDSRDVIQLVIINLTHNYL